MACGGACAAARTTARVTIYQRRGPYMRRTTPRPCLRARRAGDGTYCVGCVGYTYVRSYSTTSIHYEHQPQYHHYHRHHHQHHYHGHKPPSPARPSPSLHASPHPRYMSLTPPSRGSFARRSLGDSLRESLSGAVTLGHRNFMAFHGMSWHVMAFDGMSLVETQIEIHRHYTN